MILFHWRYFWILSLFISFTAIAQESPGEEKLFEFRASYKGDILTNFFGGIKKGTTFLGLAHLNITFNTETSGLWKGGSFFVNGASTHGSTPSECLIGDIQVVSNIEAGEHTYLQELWFKQAFEKFEITVGLQDLNEEIASLENGELFINSSFGILPIISLNLHAPIFPLTSFGITTNWELNNKMRWLNALYDGTPTDFEENPHNINWRMKSGDGLLFISEFQNEIQINNLSGIYKIGGFVHNHIAERGFNKNFPDSLNTNTAGGYVNYEQKIWVYDKKNIDLFLHLGYSPSKISLNRFYSGIGVNAVGFLSKTNDDVFGIAMAYAKLSEHLTHESIIEVTWKKRITQSIYLQPNFQYVINPSGNKGELKNAFVGILRFEFEI